ncbi:MAG: winged helix-turn-helix transcriptional regulator [Proteobacteria bacterium]|nr:winged helix-turn-helix transcriptional regulator [Pseudomonadota bacterium]
MADLDYEKMSGFFKALGNPTRLRIVKELTEGEKCVGEVESSIRVSQANVSQHLTILKAHGIVDCRKEGNARCYYLRQTDLIKKILKLIESKEA